jgi:hypothetical protein
VKTGAGIMNTETVSTTTKSPSKGTSAAAISAVGSLLAATTCCLPVLPFVLAAGTATSTAFVSSYISALRPYLLGVSVLLIALGFYQSRRASQCNCKPSVLSQVVLWLSALIVAISILLQQATGLCPPSTKLHLGLKSAASAWRSALIWNPAVSKRGPSSHSIISFKRVRRGRGARPLSSTHGEPYVRVPNKACPRLAVLIRSRIDRSQSPPSPPSPAHPRIDRVSQP